MASLTYAAVTPLNYIHTRFLEFRKDAAYRLNHNGQVCYLRAVLNDTFDPELRRITVTDTAQNVGILLVFRRDEIGRFLSRGAIRNRLCWSIVEGSEVPAVTISS